jgi:two-component system sensor histidine kinase/response regulator
MLTASSTVERLERNARTERLLVVDDDTTTAALLRRIFEAEYEVLTALDGEQALALLSQQPVDLVLLDLQMPRMDGFTCLEHIRRQPETRALPVIIVSTDNETRHIVTGLQLGANDYIAKPLNTHITKARVKTQLALKRANDAKDETIERLSRAQETQNQFYRIIAHDLKAPLTNLRLGHYMLRDYVTENVKAQDILNNMEVAVNSMLEMISGFLDASRYQEGGIQTQIEVVCVNEIIPQTVDQFRAVAARKGIALHAEPINCPLLADRLLIAQMLDNLISNAIKFSAAGTTIRIGAERRDTMLRIAVEDQGPGIPVEERAQLFQMFARLTPRPTAQETSTGLGLWIVKTLADMQQGRVGADFPADGGSIFWFELPAA